MACTAGPAGGEKNMQRKKTATDTHCPCSSFAAFGRRFCDARSLLFISRCTDHNCTAATHKQFGVGFPGSSKRKNLEQASQRSFHTAVRYGYCYNKVDVYRDSRILRSGNYAFSGKDTALILIQLLKFGLQAQFLPNSSGARLK
jgi:hypothetical protein